MAKNIVLIDAFTDQQLLDIAKTCTSFIKFAKALGYKSDSTLRKKPYIDRIKNLKIKFEYKGGVPSRIDDDFLLTNYSKVYSVTGLMNLCGLKPIGYAHKRFKLRLEKLGIIYDPLIAMRWNKGKSLPKRNIQDYLDNKASIGPSQLKHKLIKAGILDYKCLECGIANWRNKPISLHLDHIDGNRENNSLSNLRILCPNCHSQTSTYSKLKHRPKVC